MSIVSVEKKKKLSAIKRRASYKEFLLILPFIILVVIFSYYPLYGWVYAFFDYKPPMPLTMDQFVGFKWFQSIVSSPAKIRQILEVLRNTFAMSGLHIGFSWLPMAFAIFLNEIRNRPFKKIVQTVTTLPNFISWVLVYSVAFNFFSSTGMVNNLLTQLGLIKQPIMFLQSSDNVWFVQWLWLTWKNLGWAAIMYLAAIASIDRELYEAATVDGASRFQSIIHITVPGLLPTFFVLMMLNIANILTNGLEQYYVFQNAFNKDYIQVLDLYVFNVAMAGRSYSVATAISMMKSLVSVILLCGVNGFSKVVRKESIF